MAKQRENGIAWTDETWNPIRGCGRVSPECINCYAERVARRFSGPGQPYEGLIAKGGQWNNKIKVVPDHLTDPLRWRRPRRIFVNSMSDLFHEAVPEHFIDSVFAVMALADHHIFQILTKRPERMMTYMQGLLERSRDIAQSAVSLWGGKDPDAVWELVQRRIAEGPLPNVWMGTSIGNQAAADERMPFLMRTPAAVIWISVEPMIGPVNLMEWLWEPTGDWRTHNGKRQMKMILPAGQRLGWVVLGGESGEGSRPMHPNWARQVRDQCKQAGVPFFFKQWGEFVDDGNNPLPTPYPEKLRKSALKVKLDGTFVTIHSEIVGSDYAIMMKLGKRVTGTLLDGKEWLEMPAELPQ